MVRDAETVARLRDELERRGVVKAKLGGFDVDGILRGKYVSKEKLFSAADGGLGFCDVVFGWDLHDRLYDDVEVTGWHTGYPDKLAKIDLDTLRTIPWEPGTAAFLLDFCERDGTPLAVSPREVLRRVLARAAAAGYEAWLAAEYEFFVFRETPQSVREKGYRGLATLTPGMFGYSWLRASESAPLVHDLQDQLAAFDVPLEGFHTETGPGVYEAAIGVDVGLRAADKAALFKTAAKEIGHRHGVMPSFMAKWSEELPGCSGHVHMSLWKDGHNAFAGGEDGMTATMRHALGGLVALLPELTALLAPTVNSYKRFVEGTWAPTTVTWGVENRTAALRAIPFGAKATRIEVREGGADINPYLAMAAAVGAALWGIERRIEPPPALVGSAYAARDAPRLPRSLKEATALFRTSEAARELLGPRFVEHFARTREWEVRLWERAVTTWELERYFEAI
jgi:glutamine synthetase